MVFIKDYKGYLIIFTYIRMQYFFDDSNYIDYDLKILL